MGMGMEIQLLNQIERYEYLYNFNMPEYNCKDMVDEAWATIAANINMSIAECKEKWRNIRTSFLRAMKPKGSKLKRPYYLLEHLRFVMPFMKPKGIGSSGDRYDSQPKSIKYETDFIKEDLAEDGIEEDNENHSDNGIVNDLLWPKSTAVRKRRHFVSPKKTKANSLRKRNKKATSTSQRNSSSPPDFSGVNNALQMFLMSLLPELESMKEDQVRTFKIKAMMLIDEIKVNYTQVRKDMNSNNDNRLQKRLINLLLKNLERGR